MKPQPVGDLLCVHNEILCIIRSCVFVWSSTTRRSLHPPCLLVVPHIPSPRLSNSLIHLACWLFPTSHLHVFPHNSLHMLCLLVVPHIPSPRLSTTVYICFACWSFPTSHLHVFPQQSHTRSGIGLDAFFISCSAWFLSTGITEGVAPLSRSIHSFLRLNKSSELGCVNILC